MTIEEALTLATVERIDAEVLLSAQLNKDRTWLIAHGSMQLDDLQEQTLRTAIDRRKNGEPVAYITGKKDFFGRTFTVNPSVLIPRPATELLVEQIIDILRGKEVPPRRSIDTHIIAWTKLKQSPSDVTLIADIGTGSGCIAITLALELPHMHVIATDVSEEALDTAHKNAVTHGVAQRITFLQGSALDPLMDTHEPFLVASNPPYIPLGMPLDKDVQAFEPQTALFAGADGRGVIETITTQVDAHPFCRGFVMECREEQAN